VLGSSVTTLSLPPGVTTPSTLPGLLADPFGLTTDFFGIAGAIPGLNVFIGNGANGTALHPDGFNGGRLAGNGGKGYTPTTAGATGGNGGFAGWFIGSGGAGGAGGAGATGAAGVYLVGAPNSVPGANGAGLQNGGDGTPGTGQAGGKGGDLGGDGGTALAARRAPTAATADRWASSGRQTTASVDRSHDGLEQAGRAWRPDQMRCGGCVP
jgi:hypothetical protein